MTARDQLIAMAFAQITFRQSLRDIEACLRGSPHLYAMGIRGNITRTNLAYANESRNWRVYEALAQIMIRKARRLYHADSNGIDIDEMIYVFDRGYVDFGRLFRIESANAYFVIREKKNTKFNVCKF